MAANGVWPLNRGRTVLSKSMPVEVTNLTFELHLPVDSQYSLPVEARFTVFFARWGVTFDHRVKISARWGERKASNHSFYTFTPTPDIPIFLIVLWVLPSNSETSTHFHIEIPSILNKSHNWTFLLHEHFFFIFFFARIFFLGIYPCMNFFLVFSPPPPSLF